MFQDLHALHTRTSGRRILDLFAADLRRAERFSADLGEMRLDYSKTQIDDAIRAGLIALCDRAQLADKREAMFAGAPINETEGRAVLHTALRNLDGGPVHVDGAEVMADVRLTLARMRRFAEALRSGALPGAGGAITDVVNIGIGGSDLGPAMAVLALAPYHDGPRCHFVSNVDGAHIADTLRGLDPARTLVIVASKTFTTIETMTNARTARDWMQRGGGDPERQFAAVSTATDRTAAFGIPGDRVFGFADWVGGRYSLWGPIGLSLMIAIGPDDFDAFLRGAQEMDRHFQSAPWEKNLPVMLALTGIWHHQICGHPSRAVLPYDQRLARLPAYLQQLEMESNGKSVAMDGTALDQAAGPIVWGEPGTNGQHAFYQLIHQGKQVVPCEFMVAARGHEPDLAHHHRLLIANCLAQSEALMRGRPLDEARAIAAARGVAGDELERQARHRVFAGNRPSTTLIYPRLTPAMLGRIIALYEHRVFVEGVILGINSFDQWGVELGKELATSLGPVVDGTESAAAKDGSTAALVDYVLAHRDTDLT
ncbi:glucose-6-phosphate isomerase [Ruegeria pomeroyi]|uniref:Glucose-6-phosphate isomerase n=2 Tax=Ruegeria pomeroyi TaxID=89184 RepID=G6PI_RUEPO|nr:glucose-6-phosphate isomerase [Ruegeria pomeroyi]Q5LRS9.1 RecName: Full=Glucose-6-phosphate isomerase; Short=GPI; AltName: Full=Phosphoglucose isomerase; Short=PGI; AltName: Full=Phosphohexose isomerase; Short=PHI [Ruegeria pomeroyi DSS-3]AAV95317.1 glucose-6-phosphate isomerase [Ruegeria pomeroyi DSS-3]NVK95346.1 glucose-6-phosphate isomerase [Ruegeria pomeroyi]NVL03719.1 glucose-6-phosphate isomerase [Ruegeria pomeroyi]QWV08885.1 glucose-6-phosphate isomerase [Ruegeria pomeroyi]